MACSWPGMRRAQPLIHHSWMTWSPPEGGPPLVQRGEVVGIELGARGLRQLGADRGRARIGRLDAQVALDDTHATVVLAEP